MGKKLIIKGADFSTNAIETGGDEPQNLMSVFQANVTDVGKAITYSNTTHAVSVTSTNTRIGVTLTDVSSYSYTNLTITTQTGFQIALAATDGVNWAVSNADGSLDTGSSAQWEWVTDTSTIVIPASYTSIAFNVRYSDNTTTFSNNTLSNYILSIIAE